MKKKIFRLAFPGLVSLAFVTAAPAAITVLDYYRLGENDPGAVAGNVANAVTADSAGAFPLTKTDSNATLRYSSNISPAAVTSTGSTLSTIYDGANDRFSNASSVSGLNNNFGIEAFVNAASTTGIGVIAYNGNSANNGWGFFRDSGNYRALYGGTAVFGGSPVTPGTWVNLALVRNNGTSTFYINGVANATTGSDPNVPAGAFDLGGNTNNPGEFFAGLIDEARVFTFAPGQFSTSDLLINQIVPEPSRLALVAFSLVAVLRVRRRRA